MACYRRIVYVHMYNLNGLLNRHALVPNVTQTLGDAHLIPECRGRAPTTVRDKCQSGTGKITTKVMNSSAEALLNRNGSWVLAVLAGGVVILLAVGLYSQSSRSKYRVPPLAIFDRCQRRDRIYSSQNGPKNTVSSFKSQIWLWQRSTLSLMHIQSLTSSMSISSDNQSSS